MEETWKPTTVGVINIVTGAFFLLGGIAVIGGSDQPIGASAARYVSYSMGLGGEPGSAFITTLIAILSAMLIVPGLLSILGGVCALKRTMWGMALTGSVVTFLASVVPGIPAIVLTALSKKEFTVRAESRRLHQPG